MLISTYPEESQLIFLTQNPRLIFGIPVCRTGRAVNAYKNAMQYKENYLQILMIMIIV